MIFLSFDLQLPCRSRVYFFKCWTALYLKDFDRFIEKLIYTSPSDLNSLHHISIPITPKLFKGLNIGIDPSESPNSQAGVTTSLSAIASPSCDRWLVWDIFLTLLGQWLPCRYLKKRKGSDIKVFCFQIYARCNGFSSKKFSDHRARMADIHIVQAFALCSHVMIDSKPASMKFWISCSQDWQVT